ncbi:PREDICTED: carbonic anhydrase 1-like isoform X2 [Wasmannia auropunctata]|uniref:carbonic anhydrase 1-like isoform X2 n=1 Tax=Wasmannia auropunctata TaxID=64793 RepID=UPI0005EFCB40|nr:PREDICTED: carbonic anhydrase 1-like isoform X2 [Wasmannia auropunctata]
MNSSTEHERKKETVRFIQKLAHTDGKLRSPIDLNISYMKIVNLNPVQWFNYNVTPKKLKLSNTGYTVMLSATWREEEPYLCGGPLVGNYVFSQLHFHWGKTDMDGSEHRVDGGSMSMELHAVHYKSEYGTQLGALRQTDGVTILVYLFQLQAAPNPLLADIINTIPFIQAAHSSIRLIPFPLMNIMRCFQRDYFVYWGSITMTNIRNSVLWLISRRPLGISIDQIAEFRTLCNERKMPILTNCQPLQDRGDRNVFHVCPSGSSYATLLPISRDADDNYIPEDDIDRNDKQ